MIPERLSIEGLYSYQSPQVIDFRTLTGSQLFGIFGPTGSGKSSILEAITLALYGQTERLNQRDRRSYNLMNLRANHLNIEFEFCHGRQADGDDQRYLFTVRTRRNSRNFEDVKSLDRRGYQFRDGDWEPLPAGIDAEYILGLNYDNFRRTIIIPQGKFEEFMDLTETERTRMLREIFGLEKYDLALKAKMLTRKNEDQLLEIQGEMNALEGATAEYLEQIAQELADVTQKRVENEKELVSTQKSWEVQERARGLHERLSQAKKRLEDLQNQQEAYDQRQARLDQYIHCLQVFKPLIDRKKELSHEYDSTQDHLEALKKELKATREQLHGAEMMLKIARERYENRDQIRQKAEDLQTKAALIVLTREIVELDRRIGNGTTRVQEKKKEWEASRAASEQLEKDIRGLEKAMPDSGLLVALTNWENRQKSLEENRQRLEKERETLQSDTQILIEEAREAARQAGVDDLQVDLDLKDLKTVLDKRLKTLEDLLVDLDLSLSQLDQQQGLAHHAANLTEGEPCPLCGATHHPQPASPEDHQAEIDRQRSRQTTIRKDLDQTRQAIHTYDQNTSRFNEKRESIEVLNRELDTLKRAIKSHEEAYPLPAEGGQIEPEEIKALLEKASQTRQQIEEKRIRLDQHRQMSKELEAAYQSQEELLNELQQKRTADQAEVEARRKTMKVLTFHGHEHDDPEMLNQEREKLLEELEDLEQNLRDHEAAHQKARSAVDQTEGNLKSTEKNLDERRQALARHTGKLMTQLEGSAFTNLEEVQNILATNLDIDLEEKSIDTYRSDLKAQQNLVIELQSQQGKTAFDAGKWEQLGQRLEELRNLDKTLGESVGDLTRRHADIKNALARKVTLESERQKLLLRKANLAVLNSLFRKSGFVSYVSTIFLRHLCEAANRRFTRLTMGAMHLEVDADNNFIIRDHLNEGRARLAKTLSGGQRFQAALSLALALAEQVQQQVQTRQNFFFLDEGFGSQDRDSLQVIFQTLKALRKEDRIVGVISHVEELQQEIDTCLFIRNDAEKGSLVKGSWE